MKQYLLAVHMVEGAPIPSPEVTEKMYAQVDKINQEIQAAGAWVFAGGLMPADSATVVRSDNGRTTMTDGPFAETKEQLGGFWVLRCEDLDAALAWAARCSEACLGPVEVRPFQDEPEA
ncbi:hypothetical protein Asp14428_12310 [Actinoplanes sp. NBRC 14428]|uniref:YCII-related domain-containing protein n=1 Tax=Pseudosporangium ferrugineum TaxID=439699 RepID=A0A2T0SF06_9ACTN|nr:YciI family protein [Pseudosporangium ferrugineum]PRY32005.1 hypothetical protein CLV70_102216 [Pseudosporangium ferrugineum]BCJ49756.1 hypothetical protein Asp14428_12310 [Actinoplanes sp. NBRC 14428]